MEAANELKAVTKTIWEATQKYHEDLKKHTLKNLKGAIRKWRQGYHQGWSVHAVMQLTWNAPIVNSPVKCYTR